MIRKALVLFVLCGCITQATEENSVLIFLDDYEKQELAPITSSFLTAFIQEAGPIVVSASLVNNIRAAKKPVEEDPLNLYKIAEKLYLNTQKTLPEKSLLRDIIASTIQFDENCARKWIIKKINPCLYLFLPKKYLLSKKISPEQVQQLLPDEAPLTDTEKSLSLKVNHLLTTSATTIDSCAIEHTSADYFIDSLNKIFISRREYGSHTTAPSLSIFITGHGLTNYAVCHLPLDQFRLFLSFLETIPLRLLIYSSCYAAGLNTKRIYQDVAAAVQKTYSFPIITIALTDAATRTPLVTVMLERDGLKPDVAGDFDCLVQELSRPEIIDYRKAILCIEPMVREPNIPQIRYPGLPWFSILDYDIVASIGGIMAKTRTQPLDIARFFAKQGKPAAPYAILLYAQDIPFELIIDTKMPTTAGNDPSLATTGNCYVPIFVSMIPGAVMHTIKKISSSCNTALDIMANFYLEELYYPKLFIIDELTAPFSAQMSKALSTDATSGTLTNVIVDIAKDNCTKYFTYQDTVYIAFGCAQEDDEDFGPEQLPVVANEEQRAAYESLLKKYGKHATIKQLEPEHTYLTTETAAAIRHTQATLKQQPASTRKPQQKKCTVYKRQSKKRALAKARFCQRTRTYR